MKEIISLGYNCQPNYVLGKMGIRTTGCVLDGLISYKLQRVVELLNCDFSTFFENPKVEKSQHYSQFVTVRDELNELVSIHDFSPQDEVNRELILQRLDYKSFLTKIKTSPNTLVFVRRNKGYEEASASINLYYTLEKLRGANPFELIIFQSKPFEDEFSTYPNFKFFRDKIWEWNHQSCVWEGDYELWGKVFLQS